MKKTMMRFLVCSLGTAGVLGLAACSNGPVDPEPSNGTARFSQASDRQLGLVLASVYLPATIFGTEPLIAFLDSAFSMGECPQVEQRDDWQIVTGDQCTTAEGWRYDGVMQVRGIEGAEDGGEARFEGYSRVSPGGIAYRYDGHIQFSATGDIVDRMDTELDMELAGETLSVHVSVSCQTAVDEEILCTIEPGAVVDIGGLGRFELEGTTGLISWAGVIVFRGAETMRAEYQPDGCVQYTIDGGAPQTWCAGGGSAPGLLPAR